MVAKTKKTKAVVNKKSTALVVPTVNLFEDANVGFENIGIEDSRIPMLSILQSGSPQCKRSNGKYIEGAREGNLFNSVTEKLYDGDEGVEIIIAAYDRVYIEWIPRNSDGSGGGFAGVHTKDSQTVLTATKTEDCRDGRLDNGNELANTMQFYVLLKKAEGGVTKMLIPMSSTQLTPGRTLVAKLQDLVETDPKSGRAYTPPLFYSIYNLKTVVQTKGENSWYNYKTEFVRTLDIQDADDVQLYLAGKEFHTLVSSKEVEINRDKMDEGTQTTGKTKNVTPEVDEENVAF